MNAITKFLSVNTFVPFELSQEDLATLNAWQNHTRYCHYFSLSTPNDKTLTGNWDTLFFSLEDLNKFAEQIHQNNPNLKLQYSLGAKHIHGAMKSTTNEYWILWQQKHKERIANIEKQIELKTQKNLERKEKLAKWLDAMKEDEHYCHYFCVFHKGSEVYPFGLNQAPYYTFEEAEKVLNEYQMARPQYDFYVGSGAIDSDYVLIEDYSNEAEKIWVQHHKARLQSLKEPAA